jgi:hypothetical protein
MVVDVEGVEVLRSKKGSDFKRRDCDEARLEQREWVKKRRR